MTRVLLKLSGEALGDASGQGLALSGVASLCDEAGAFVEAGGELGIVVGGGNLVRGHALAEAGFDRVAADHIGMLGTVLNGLAMSELLRQRGLATRVYAAVGIAGIAEQYHRDDAVEALSSGQICLFTGGIGSPLFTTDTAACLRGIEIGAELVLKATKVDGVYSADPRQDPNAVRYESLTYGEVLAQDLRVMDLTAICLCQDHGLPLVVFDMTTAGALTRIVRGEAVGTRIVG